MTEDVTASWLGRTEAAEDIANASAIRGLAALLDHDGAPWRSNVMPPLAHWLYFPPQARQSELGEDGHPKPGGLIPSSLFPRRMWAGSRVRFHEDIPLGAKMSRRSEVVNVARKDGASGPLVFVTLRHVVLSNGALALEEEQDLVYRPINATSPVHPAAPQSPSVESAGGDRVVVPDAVMLFRFSALTFNAHRIHYDRRYAIEREGYPDLVVHGPLAATLLMDAWLQRTAGQPARFSFRAQRPLYVDRPVRLDVQGDAGMARLTALDASGTACMTAQVSAV
ncbi:MAG: hypothetical protein JHD15_17060 [Phenylobacterium sp.]|uniref:hypothetical protein n=1 Tax=Phenylobacterium sp. TaxID=1871053 RepID=UPI001A20C3A6|nr:hypothetical protein [Phenylobacterium sp.]MBJ7412056.1 hypothetical protein [Phenylobacterium sp.]